MAVPPTLDRLTRAGHLRRTVALAVGSVVLAAAPPGRMAPPSATVLVRVRETPGDHPLRNAQVLVLGGESSRFTDARGEALLPREGAGPLHLRVRQLGYVFVDTTLPPIGPGAAPLDTVQVTLRRVVHQLGGVAVRTGRACDSIESPTLTASVLEQLRMGAERYVAFREAYPFRVAMVRRTKELLGDRPIVESRETSHSSDWGLRYEPGQVVRRLRAGFTVPLLFLAALADSVFWDRHCFSAAGVEELKGARVVRLEFSPTRDTRGADWSGVAFVDSATSLLRRVEFRLTGLEPDDLPARLEGYTTFAMPAHLIVVPDTTIAIWWRTGLSRRSGWGSPSVGQVLWVERLEYTRRPPPPDEFPPAL